MKTYTPRAAEITQNWQVIDASGKVLGRLASQIARILMGKDKPIFTPNLDTGDYVVVINAAQIKVTGKKMKDKLYHRHSLYPGGLKAIPLEKIMATHPKRALELAVKGMLPKNALGRAMFRKLRAYPGPTHPHQGQVKNG